MAFNATDSCGAKSLGIFKMEIDRYMISTSVTGYGEKAGEWC